MSFLRQRGFPVRLGRRRCYHNGGYREGQHGKKESRRGKEECPERREHTMLCIVIFPNLGLIPVRRASEHFRSLFLPIIAQQ